MAAVYLIWLCAVITGARDTKYSTYENSVLLADVYLDSVAVRMGVGTGYSAIKLPWVSLTFLVTPRLMVWRRRQADSAPVETEATDWGLESPYGSP